jgi:magnesium transporter
LNSVKVDTEDVEAVSCKNDLEAIPVVDELGRLVGRITIDDIVDVIRTKPMRITSWQVSRKMLSR